MDIISKARAVSNNGSYKDVTIQFTVHQNSIVNIRGVDGITPRDTIESITLPSSYVDSKKRHWVIDSIGPRVINKRIRKGVPIGSNTVINRIKKLVIPDSITYVSPFAFSNAMGIENVVWSKNCSVIPEYCFDSCFLLESIKNIENVDTVHDGAFTYTGFVNFTWPKNCEKIPYGCFKGCRHLQKINIPSRVKAIEMRAFESCDGLKEFTWPKDCIEVSAFCFNHCMRLEKINFLGNVQRIMQGAFACTNMTLFDASQTEITFLHPDAFPQRCKIIYPFYC